MSGRRPVQVYLSDEALAEWQHLADRNGITVTALLEAAGLAPADKPKVGTEWVPLARTW